MYKDCSRCKVTKRHSEFNKNKTRPFGLAVQCKLCVKEGYQTNKSKYKANKERADTPEKKEARNKKNRERYNVETGRAYVKTPRGSYTRYKANAKSTGKVFEITLTDFMKLWKEPCSYCGIEIPTIGVDRVDSGVGYLAGNIVACCSVCNMMKRHHSVKFFTAHISKVLTHLKG